MKILRKIELTWNIVYYFAYRADYRLHAAFNKINPFLLINKLPFQKRMLEKKGIDINKELDYSFKNPKTGISSIRSAGFMFILSFLISLTFFCLLQAVLNKSNLASFLIIVFAIPFVIINFYYIVYKDKYLDYFKLFETKPKVWKIKWAVTSIMIVVAIILMLVGSIYLMGYAIHH